MKEAVENIMLLGQKVVDDMGDQMMAMSAGMSILFRDYNAKLLDEKVSEKSKQAYARRMYYLIGKVQLVREHIQAMKEAGENWVAWLRQESDRIIDIHQKVAIPAAGYSLSCRRGCSACCHQKTTVIPEEFQDVAAAIKEGQIKIDMDQMRKQAKWSAEDYLKNIKDSKCLFLSDAGECSIYDKRPLACRVYMVVSDPIMCDISLKDQPDPAVSPSPDGEALATAAFNETVKIGHLPEVLLGLLEEEKEDSLCQTTK